MRSQSTETDAECPCPRHSVPRLIEALLTGETVAVRDGATFRRVIHTLDWRAIGCRWRRAADGNGVLVVLNRVDAVVVLRAALNKIVANAPESEPEYQVWSDTEEAERWGLDQGASQAAQIARTAVARVEKCDAKEKS